jgi:mannitol 2-dehydrogenase
MQKTARAAKDDPSAWLAMSDIYGEVGRSEAFAGVFAHCLETLWAKGTRQTLKAYLAGTL